jgi:glycerol uptake facilitator-like aquaporin
MIEFTGSLALLLISYGIAIDQTNAK